MLNKMVIGNQHLFRFENEKRGKQFV